MRSLVQATPAYDLSVDITTTAYGHSLSFISFVPTAPDWVVLHVPHGSLEVPDAVRIFFSGILN